MRYACPTSELMTTRSFDDLREDRAHFTGALSQNVSLDLFGPDPYFEHTALALAIVSSNGKCFLKVNEAFARMHGMSRSRLTDAPLERVVAPCDKSRLIPLVRNAGDGDRYSYEIQHRRKNSGTFDAMVDMTVVRTGLKEVLFRTMQVVDITERKKAETDLINSEARYRKLLESTTDFIYETDHNGRFRYFQCRAMKDFLGYSIQDLDGLSLLDLVHPSYRSTIESAYRKQLQENKCNTFQEFPVLTKKGRVVWIAQSVTLVKESPNRTSYVALAHDITDRKLTKGRRRQSQIELEDLQDWYVATQTTVALAHELNQPLNAVCSYNEAALRMLKSGNPYPEKLKHALAASVQQCERAGKVMRDLLAFLTKGHAPLTKDSIDINSVVRQALVDMDEGARADSITLVQNLGSDLGVALAHRLHVEKVLGNLLRNSFEAIRASHKVPGKITVQTDRQGGFVLVTVRDNGPGFSIEQSSRIWEPFYTTKDQGVGMGLPVSRALIEAHGGKLWAEAGDGAVFRFTVPLAR
jgi:two-component system, LuxR family, sensor kinase FixL